MDPGFRNVIVALRKNGIKVEQAAEWLDAALQGSPTAIRKVNENSGAYGMLYFGTPEMAEDNPDKFLQK